MNVLELESDFDKIYFCFSTCHRSGSLGNRLCNGDLQAGDLLRNVEMFPRSVGGGMREGLGRGES